MKWEPIPGCPDGITSRVGHACFDVGRKYKSQCWNAVLWAEGTFHVLGDYRTEKLAKAACYRKARSLWVRMGRDLKQT